MPFRSQCLCQSVCYHVLRWTIFQSCRSIFNAVPDEVVLDVDMFRTSVVLRIVCEGDCALIVAINDVLIADAVTDFAEKAEEPDLLLECVEESHVFRFRSGEGDRALLLRRVGDRSSCHGGDKS